MPSPRRAGAAVAVGRPAHRRLDAERAESRPRSAGGIDALVVVTVGLGNLVAAGWSAGGDGAASGTINTIVVRRRADPEPAALVNLALTVTEVKTLVLRRGRAAVRRRPARQRDVDRRGRDRGHRAAAPRCASADPISEAGWVVARAARAALDRAIGDWQERHR